MPFQPEDLLKLFLALLAGGLIGSEREYRDKAAGFRTLIFICTGATLFTILSYAMSTTGDPNRIAASIVTGVGFLGASYMHCTWSASGSLQAHEQVMSRLFADTEVKEFHLSSS